VCAAKNAGVARFEVASQVTALSPFSQNWNVDPGVRSGPGASGAVEDVWLVRTQQRFDGLGRFHLRADRPCRRPDRIPASRGMSVEPNSGNIVVRQSSKRAFRARDYHGCSFCADAAP
jgi:hypothetical protein